ncbi:MAG TPA: hypothetical protein VFG21_11480 [Xanthomonadaceae bacterium]|nr:hypothetical protein [Xanthomonadaceae bacterium]
MPPIFRNLLLFTGHVYDPRPFLDEEATAQAGEPGANPASVAPTGDPR